MKISVYDTYVKKEGGSVMHFDILVNETTSIEEVYKHGKEYLIQKKVSNSDLTTNECRFCHIEKAPKDVEKSIREKGFHIIEIENCD